MIKIFEKFASLEDPYGEEIWDDSDINEFDYVKLIDPKKAEFAGGERFPDVPKSEQNHMIWWHMADADPKYIGKIGRVLFMKDFKVNFEPDRVDCIFVSYDDKEGKWFRKDKFKKA